VRVCLEGRSLFVTGATGFVGKVLVEKLLRCFRSEVNKVFLLVRPGNGRNAQERLHEEIIGSAIWETLDAEIGAERREIICRDKLVAVAGDVTMPSLGVSDADFEEIERAGTEILFHCAASVNFDDPLEVALKLNTRGALETLKVAKEVLKVKAMVHVSTAYVGANQKHEKIISEKVQSLDFNPEDALAKSTKKTAGSDQIGLSRLQLKIQGDFPNTYTLTKAMAEVILERHHGDVPLSIVRPSIVGASWREPLPGWVDVVSAATAVFIGGALGVLTILHGKPRGVAAIVPVDLVVNHMLIACAEIFGKTGELQVSHSCSSTYNPCRWRVVISSVRDGFNRRPPPMKLTPGPVRFKMIQSEQQFAAEWVLKYQFPTWAFGQFAKATGSKSASINRKKLDLLVERAQYMMNLFEPFTSVEYLFDTSVAKFWESQKGGTGPTLSVDALDIVWTRYFENYVYGMNRFILHEDVVPVSQSAVTHNDVSLTLGRLLQWDPDHHRISFPGIISDISWAYTSSRRPGYTRSGVLGRLMGLTGWREGLAHEAKHVPRAVKRSVSDMRRLVLRAKKVRQAIKSELRNNPDRIRTDITAKAEGYLDEIASTLTDGPPRSFAWALRKIWRRIYEGIRVHEEGLESLRKVIADAKHPVVLVPTHRSYVDFLMLSFLFFAFNLPVPFIAATTDFLEMKGISGLLRSSGAFFLRRQGAFQQDPLYAAVFSAYMQQLLVDRQIVEFYLEGTRSRFGKSLEPKDGLTRICIEPVMDGRLEDVILVPISIDYEKALEATLYSHEMLGGSKMPETIENLFRSAMILRENFGFVSVQFSDHISVRAMLQRNQETTLQEFAPKLGLQVVDAMNSAAVCMPIHLVSTLLLTYRHGMTLEQLVPSVEWLRMEIIKRGGYVACSEGEHRVDLVKRAVKLLGIVLQERSSPRVLEVAVKNSPKDYHNMVVLGYYRNKIIHLFALEAMWACSIYAHSVRRQQQSEMVVVEAVPGRRLRRQLQTFSVSNSPPRPPSQQQQSRCISAELSDVEEDVTFLESMLSQEFVHSQRGTPERIQGGFFQLKEDEIVQIDQNGILQVQENAKAERMFGFLCSMAWPFIDSYFVALTSLKALASDVKVKKDDLGQRMLTLAENLYHDRVILHYESCASITLQNALEIFHQWGVVDFVQGDLPRSIGKPKQTETYVLIKEPYKERNVLQALIDRIDSLRGPVRGSQFGPYSVADYPMLARI